MGTSEGGGLNRRRALQTLATGAAGVATSPLWVEALIALADEAGQMRAHAHPFQAAPAAPWTPKALTAAQNETVIVLTELIIPETDTPGARGALVNRFIDDVLQKAPQGERESFLRGLAWLDRRTRTLFRKDFAAATPAQQTDLLTRLSAEGNPPREHQAGVDFFRAVKALTITGYYTTEIGLRQELGDPGQLFLPQFAGCDHPEHQA